MVKDLLVEDIDMHVIYFCEDATRIAKPVRNEQDKKDKNVRVVGMPVVSVKIGDHCYHGLCDIGASISVIPFSLHQEVMHDISPVEIEEIDVTIKLANRDTISPLGIVRDVEVLCGKIKYPTDFLVLGSAQDNFCPIIFGRPFLNTVGAEIDCAKQKVKVKFCDESHEFNFSKSSKQHHAKDLPNEDAIVGLASIAVPPTDPLEKYLLDHENDMHMKERNEIGEIFFR